MNSGSPRYMCVAATFSCQSELLRLHGQSSDALNDGQSPRGQCLCVEMLLPPRLQICLAYSSLPEKWHFYVHSPLKFVGSPDFSTIDSPLLSYLKHSDFDERQDCSQ